MTSLPVSVKLTLLFDVVLSTGKQHGGRKICMGDSGDLKGWRPELLLSFGDCVHQNVIPTARQLPRRKVFETFKQINGQSCFCAPCVLCE